MRNTRATLGLGAGLLLVLRAGTRRSGGARVPRHAGRLRHTSWVMTHLGATTVLVPGGMLAYAFDKHQIDAAKFLTPAVDQRQRLQDHVKLIYKPGWYQPEAVLELFINNDRWNALDDQQQTVLETACRAKLLATLAESPGPENGRARRTR